MSHVEHAPHIAGWLVLSASLCACATSGSGAPQPDGLLQENTAAACSDDIDNDGDGFVDCEDQDCWMLVACQDVVPLPDGGPRDASATLDGDGAARGCATHWDCDQGWFCYHEQCQHGDGMDVYHCGKAGCPPGHWCIDKSGARSRCAEDPDYVCQSACDCGPAHCCIEVPALGGRRCVKDLLDPWLPAGTLLDPDIRCQKGAKPDPTYCCDAPSCFAARAARANASSFRCHRSNVPAAVSSQNLCGARTCFGTACNCPADHHCVDTVPRGPGSLPPAGKACGILTGGTCVVSSMAEAVFGVKPADLLFCCSDCNAKNVGQPCEAGAFEAAKPATWAYQRLVARCDPAPASGCVCGDGICCASEVKAGCPDCLCGNGRCDEPNESAASCPPDCTATCGNGRCDEPNESAASCPADCGDNCADHALYEALQERVCGDGTCSMTHTCDWHEVESCRTCSLDCGPCRWEPAYNQGSPPAMQESLFGVWGSSATDVFAVGDYGTVLHFDGNAWSPMATGTSNRLSAVWGNAPTNVFAVGHVGTVLHFDGAAWAPIDVGTTSALLGVWGSSATNIFAVGSLGTVVRFDGTSWSATTVDAGQLRGVWGSSATNVYAVSDDGFDSRILHFDGNDWAPIASAASTSLWAIWGASPTEIFAVGRPGTVLHFDGTGWSKMPTGTSQTLLDVWGSSATDVHAVGVALTRLHYDGAGWSLTNSGGVGALRAVWGSGSEVYAVGFNGMVLHQSGGGAWSPMNEVTWLHSVWGSSDNDVYAVGSAGLMHFDGAAWMPMDAGVDSDVAFRAVWGSSATEVFALTASSELLRFDGTAWAPMDPDPMDSYPEMNDIWASSSAGLFGVGTAGAIVHHDGNAWETHTSNTSARLKAVWGSSATDVFAVGTEYDGEYDIHLGVALHYDGSAWSKTPMLLAVDLEDLWGTSPTSLFAIGTLHLDKEQMAPGILRFDGTGWSWMLTDLHPNLRLRAVWGNSATDIFVVGTSGTVLRLDGATWGPAAADLREYGSRCRDLQDVGGAAGGDGYIVGQGQLILRDKQP